MLFDPTDRRATPARVPDWGCARSIVLGSWLAASALVLARAAWSRRGNRQARRRQHRRRRFPKAPPPRTWPRRSSLPAPRPSSTPKPPTASRSRCISISAGSSSRRATSMRPCSNIRTRSPSLETKRRGSFQPADPALAHRRMAGALDRLGRFAQAEVHYQKALKVCPERPQNLERRRLQLLPPGPLG